MTESIVLNDMREITKEELTNIEQCGRVGFTCKEVAAVLSVPLDEVADQFNKEVGPIYEAWYKGRLQGELDLRTAIMREAVAGTAPMAEKMRHLLAKADEENRKLLY